MVLFLVVVERGFVDDEVLGIGWVVVVGKIYYRDDGRGGYGSYSV